MIARENLLLLRAVKDACSHTTEQITTNFSKQEPANEPPVKLLASWEVVLMHGKHQDSKQEGPEKSV